MYVMGICKYIYSPSNQEPISYFLERNNRNIRPRLHVSGFVCIRKHFVADSKVYASTRIRIRCVFDRPHVPTKTIRSSNSNSLELLREHALSEITSPRCRLLLAILTRVNKFCLCF